MAGQTRGTLHATPCPHCKKPNDFRGLAPGGGEAMGDYGLERGAVLICDHCERRFQVVRVEQTTMIWLRPV